MIRALLVGAAALGAAIAPTAAQAQVADELAQTSQLAGRIADFSPQTIMPILAAAGFTVAQESLNGRAAVGVKLPSGQGGLLMVPNCAQGTCPGLQIVAFIQDAKPATARNAFNGNRPSPKAVEVSPQLITIRRYLVGDAGYEVQNFLVETALAFYSTQWWFEDTGAAGGNVVFAPLLPEAAPAPSAGQIGVHRQALTVAPADPSDLGDTSYVFGR